MSEQNALRLAALLDEGNAVVYRKHATEAAAELRRLHEENTALRKCAIKYLDYLNIPNQKEALKSDIKNKDMLR